MYHTIRRLGIPDSNIVLMLADDMPCNARNPFPGGVYNSKDHKLNLYEGDVEVDYRCVNIPEKFYFLRFSLFRAFVAPLLYMARNLSIRGGFVFGDECHSRSNASSICNDDYRQRQPTTTTS